MKYFCPECFSELEEVTGCGSVSYFCNKCNCLVSKKKILSEEELKKREEKREQ